MSFKCTRCGGDHHVSACLLAIIEQNNKPPSIPKPLPKRTASPKALPQTNNWEAEAQKAHNLKAVGDAQMNLIGAKQRAGMPLNIEEQNLLKQQQRKGGGKAGPLIIIGLVGAFLLSSGNDHSSTDNSNKNTDVDTQVSSKLSKDLLIHAPTFKTEILHRDFKRETISPAIGAYYSKETKSFYISRGTSVDQASKKAAEDCWANVRNDLSCSFMFKIVSNVKACAHISIINGIPQGMIFNYTYPSEMPEYTNKVYTICNSAEDERRANFKKSIDNQKNGLRFGGRFDLCSPKD